MEVVKNFTVDQIDGCEFVKSKVVGNMIISHDQNFDGYYTGDVRVVYADGSHTVISSEEAQKCMDSGEWTVLRKIPTVKNLSDLNDEQLKELDGYIEEFTISKAYIEAFIAQNNLDENEVWEKVDVDYKEAMSRQHG